MKILTSSYRHHALSFCTAGQAIIFMKCVPAIISYLTDSKSYLQLTVQIQQSSRVQLQSPSQTGLEHKRKRQPVRLNKRSYIIVSNDSSTLTDSNLFQWPLSACKSILNCW